MPGTMWCTVNSNLFHKRSSIAVIVIAIKKSFAILCMKKIFAIRTRIIPVLYSKAGAYPQSELFGFRFLFCCQSHQNTVLPNAHFLSSNQEIGDTCAIIEQHEDNLIVFVLFHCPDFCNFFFCEFCTCMLVWIAVFVLGDLGLDS